ncbi:tetratricopeptide repeat protein [Roseibacterium sp. SDUM158017]|uniref:tetratricopeptide repeat protein n=1 Tax=Roseicyclus salinarum TaxID=3036773 RepID=UPI0024158377|nr:tetratricopeptide repeat protein [Roseibacterium sp. SDUM158017]MDG4649987.1 tetratricopeptide repeat protein [Roseibacterium sp. SDUM158017]
MKAGSGLKALCALGVAGALAVSASTASAQDAGSVPERRAAVFASLIDAPSDRALMQEYARLSVEMRDYEAAAATLERLIDLEPENAGARLELATAYYALGNYPLANYHFDIASASGALTPAQAGAVDAYRAAAAQQDRPSRLSGVIAAGAVTSEGETGFLGTAQLDWRIDLGDANATDWVTEIGISSFVLGAGAGADTNDSQRILLRTGPELKLAGEAFGPRLQPYVELEAVRYPDASASDFDAVYLGLAYQNTYSAEWSSFADASIGRGERRASGDTMDFLYAVGGLTYRPSREAQFRMAASYSREEEQDREEDGHGLRADYVRAFAAPAALDARNWLAGAFAGIDWFDITEAATQRDETVRSAGLFLRSYLGRDLFIETRASHLRRDGGTGTEETLVSMQLGWEF